MNFRIYIILLLIAATVTSYAQEVVTGLQFNEAVAIEAKKVEQATNSCNCKKSGEEEEIRLLLPFYDDFSTSNIYPDQDLWQGRSVFVNKDFGYMPINIGVATFDAIDSIGKVYSNATSAPFMTDVLMSQQIRLDSIFSSDPRPIELYDSLYLSFFYQPQGVGDAPQLQDSLILEFARYTGNEVYSHMDSIYVFASMYINEGEYINPLDTLYAPAILGCNPNVYTIVYAKYSFYDSILIACDSVFVPEVNWERQWYSEGLSFNDFYDTNGVYMKQIMIPIIDTNFFVDNFRFRFRNYCSLSNDYYPPTWKSNGDQWNIDMVYLNYNRSAGDTTYRAITFSQRAPSFLKQYQVMPYRQYRYSPSFNTADTIHMYIANLDSVEHNTRYLYKVEQVNGNFNYMYDGGNCNLKPFYEVGFQSCDGGCGTSHACPPVNSLFSLDYDRDTTSYKITHYISDSSEQNSIVDSAIYHQGFYNYYAYDDGTPEIGWGYDGSGGAQIAYKFELSTIDTLWGVQMYFNKTLNNANELYFDLMVWKDNNGKPGEAIYRQESEKVGWENGLYKFTPYMLDDPQIVTGTIYVGWEQYESVSYNIGMDANNNAMDKIFYKIDSVWKKATVPGALLMRPIIGANMILSTKSPEQNNKDLVIYPNPAGTYVSLRNSIIFEKNSAQLTIFNMFGAQVLVTSNLSDPIDISRLPQGIYIVKVISDGQIYSVKLLVNR